MSARRNRMARAQATVELALCSIVLVPLILYSLFLFDVLNFRLDGQEAALAAPWDFTALDYQDHGDSSDVQAAAKMLRRHNCDHFDAYDSFDDAYDCSSVHHTDLAAHACWLVAKNAGGEKGQQVECGIATSVGMDGFKGNLPNVVNKGGKVYCTARLGVVNYFLPQKVLMDFSQVDTTTTVKMGAGDGVHTFAQDHSGDQVILFKTEKLSLIADSWAMTTTDAADRDQGSLMGMTLGSGGPLYDRAGANWVSSKADKAKQVGDDLIQDEIISQMSTMEIMTVFHSLKWGDDPTTIQVGWTADLPPDNDGNYSSPWSDQSEVPQTYSARKVSYMGLDAP